MKEKDLFHTPDEPTEGELTNSTGSSGSKTHAKINLILVARVLSIIFTPFYLPILGLLVLFLFSYMSNLNFVYKLRVLLMVYAFTLFIPTLLIRLYRHYHGWTLLEMGTRERRAIPYVISMLCYFACYYLMKYFHIPHFMARILVTAITIQIACALVNTRWKVSTHTAGIGGVAGALLALSAVFAFNPIAWFCLTVIVAGMVGTARMILRQHTLAQVVAGFGIGVLTGFLMIT